MSKVVVKSTFTENKITYPSGSVLDEKEIPKCCKDLVEPYDEKKHKYAVPFDPAENARADEIGTKAMKTGDLKNK
jgi:hypothetical protein